MQFLYSLAHPLNHSRSLTDWPTDLYAKVLPFFFTCPLTYCTYQHTYLFSHSLIFRSSFTHSLPPFLSSFIPSLLYLFVGLLMDSFGTLGCRSTMEKVQLNWLPICVWELHTFLCFFGRMPQCHKGSTRETLGGHVRKIWWSLKRKSPKAFVDRALFSKNPWGQRVKREGKWRLRMMMMSLIWRNLSEDCSCGHINFYPWWIDLCFFATVITVDVFPLHVQKLHVCPCWWPFLGQVRPPRWLIWVADKAFCWLLSARGMASEAVS